MTRRNSLTDHVCSQCAGDIRMMCALGTRFCSEGCRKAHREEWARQVRA